MGFLFRVRLLAEGFLSVVLPAVQSIMQMGLWLPRLTHLGIVRLLATIPPGDLYPQPMPTTMLAPSDMIGLGKSTLLGTPWGVKH